MKNQLGPYITKLREDKGWSQRELAQRAGHSQTAISKLEGGGIKDPGISFLLDIAKALKTPVYTLVLAYQGKAPNFREIVDKPTLKKALKKSVDSVLDEHFPD